MRRILGLALASLVLFGAVSPGLNSTERYLAYRVRIERGESGYAMSDRLSRIAHARAYEISTDFRHRFGTYWRMGLTCVAGEIIAHKYTRDGIYAVRWAIRQWNLSAIHKPFLDNYGKKWRHYGVGAIYRYGQWWMVVSFSRC